MSLYRTELRRLVKRRFVRYLTLAGLLVLVAVAIGMFVTNERIGPAQRAAAEQAAERDYRQNVESAQQYRAECERVAATGATSERGFPADCSTITPTPRESFQAQWYLPATFDFQEEFSTALVIFAAVLALVVLLAGASFVGAEWSSGGMMNLLLWQPQRLRVLLTKLAALLTGVLGLAVVAMAAWTAAFWGIASQRGSTAGMTSGVWQSFGLTGLRAAALVLIAAALGFGLASLGRHTALALGGVLGVLVIGQFGVGMLLSMANVRFVEAWLLPTYLLAWMEKKVTLQNYDACQASYTGNCEAVTMDITWQDSSVLLSVSLVLVLGAALWTMRRRDIT
ncbi:ABC transporter permease subunit [Plantactinospora sp. CA-290183]|uniref:ABC transporter permease subunit n=1 Tax=Plantactinospora sp. CA-290183 TaxID=3240006 RepID=UPI003D8BFD8E